ncbi:MAG: hypothetical protein HXS41_14695 [Theionarchaea archaeon]|nr:hypothetical protein [Theionarchaea archaeon]MBU7001860.1 hypothetical protein [Theionarchaea archaeon]MBU7022299.1 hypothetical protein [Theionarchaea archaeon]MBU7035054.1 hypothetical protein [Theionarchaea archaeon]MBU7040670.1 hypothetical protein [Theionarchaea archaeon]
MNPLTWLPRGFHYFEQACIKIATQGWHRPGFYLSTLFTAPLALYLYRKEVRSRLVRVILLILANILLFFSIVLITRLWIFLLLLPVARLVKVIYTRFRIGEKEEKPIAWKDAIVISKDGEVFSRPRLRFTMEKLDLLALLIILFIFLSFLVNADKFQPLGDDGWYHMAVARKFIELKEIPLWDTWEFQPVGRPHLYPPLLHILIAFFSADADHVIEGAKVLQIVLYPAALLTSWYFARLLFSSKIAFIALIILSMDATFLLIFIGVMPSSLVNLFFPLLLLAFLSKRLGWSVFFMVLCLYSHLSFPFLVLVCLLVLSYKYRTYFSFYRKFVVLSLIFYLPWALRVLLFRDFLRSFATVVGNPVLGLVIGMLSLQIFNPMFLYFGIKGLRRSSGINRDLIKYILIGFLPALIFYGGRYWFHTAPFWAILIALYLEKWITSRKRVALLLLLGLVPMPLIAIGVPGGGSPVLPSITALDGAVGLHFLDFGPRENDLALKAFIEQNTGPDQIIHVDEPSLADRIVVLTGRRVDNGMWFEVGSIEMQRVIEVARHEEKPAIFVYRNREILPSVDTYFAIGEYWIGIRY